MTVASHNENRYIYNIRFYMFVKVCVYMCVVISVCLYVKEQLAGVSFCLLPHESIGTELRC